MDINATLGGEENKIELTKSSLYYLKETRKWTKFLSILGFVFIGLMIIVSISFGSLMSNFAGEGVEPPFPSFAMFIIYLIIGAIYFFPVFYLFKFTSHIKSGLERRSSEQFNNAFKYLKSHFEFVGVLVIIGLGIYALVFLGLIIGGAISLL